MACNIQKFIRNKTAIIIIKIQVILVIIIIIIFHITKADNLLLLLLSHLLNEILVLIALIMGILKIIMDFINNQGSLFEWLKIIRNLLLQQFQLIHLRKLIKFYHHLHQVNLIHNITIICQLVPNLYHLNPHHNPHN